MLRAKSLHSIYSFVCLYFSLLNRPIPKQVGFWATYDSPEHSIKLLLKAIIPSRESLKVIKDGHNFILYPFWTVMASQWAGKKQQIDINGGRRRDASYDGNRLQNCIKACRPLTVGAFRRELYDIFSRFLTSTFIRSLPVCQEAVFRKYPKPKHFGVVFEPLLHTLCNIYQSRGNPCCALMLPSM